jgi:hypothetical protein
MPSLILSCETATVVLFFFHAFSPNQYIVGCGRTTPHSRPIPHEYYGGPLGIKAILSAINIFDIVRT